MVFGGAALVCLGAFAGNGFMPATARASSTSMRIGTYNIRYEHGDKGTPNDWIERRADVVELILKLDLDAFGLQEVCNGQVDYLTNNLPQYAMVCAYREGGERKGQASPVFYRKDRFDAVKSGTFWLSETPDAPGSKSWDAACPRICTWVRLSDKATGRTFCFANTHTDHKSELARTEGMKLIMKRMREFAPDGMPVVFTGDHNCGEWEESAKIASAALRDTVHATEKPPVGPYRTYNAFRWRENPPAAEVVKLPAEKRQGRGDYIYVSDGIRVKSHVCHDDTRPGTKLYPSDHFPLSAEIELPQ